MPLILDFCHSENYMTVIFIQGILFFLTKLFFIQIVVFRYHQAFTVNCFHFQPENIMLLDRQSTKIKLIDFGLARKLNDKEDYRAMMGTAEFVGKFSCVWRTVNRGGGR